MAAAALKPPAPTMQPTPPKARPTPEPREPRAKRPGTLGPALRVMISVVIVWHFTAIFLAALSIDGDSRLVTSIAQGRPMQWYLDALYLNQGHSFFAPNVGPSGVVHYELFNQGGQSVGEGDLPSLKEHWPRLRYHRHFMLADQAVLGDDDYSKYWSRAYLEAFARQVLREHADAQTVRLRHYAHWPLPLEFETKARTDNYGWDRAYRDFAQFMSRNGISVDEHGYQLLMEVTQRRSDLGPEEATQSGAWQSNGRIETANRWGGGPR